VDILFLDDDANRVSLFEMNSKTKVTHVTTVPAMCAALAERKFDLIMLDHDLQHFVDGVEITGVDAAKFLAENRSLLGDHQQVVIHSANSLGVSNMLSHMKHADHLCVDVVWFAWVRVRNEGGNIVFNML